MEVNGGGFNRRVVLLRESDFKGMDESRFIDLKLDFSSETQKIGDTTALSIFDRDGDLSSGGSCRITVNDRGIKRGRKSIKSWRWISRHHGQVLNDIMSLSYPIGKFVHATALVFLTHRRLH